MAVVCIETRMDRMRNLLKPFGRERSQPLDASREQEGHAAPSSPPPQPQSADALLDEDEDFLLALQLSAAEQGPVRGGASRPAAPLRAATTAQPLEPTDSDEAIARHLQEQLDLEAAASGPAHGPPGRQKPPDMLHGAPQLPPAQPIPSAPHCQPPAPSAPWALSPRATHPPSAGPRDDNRSVPSLPADPNVCGGCGKPVHWLAVVPTALGRRWHPACLRCAHCSARIQVRICAASFSVLGVLVLRPCNDTAHDARCFVPGCAQGYRLEAAPYCIGARCALPTWYETRLCSENWSPGL